MNVADMQRLITDLGFTPRQRDNWYPLQCSPQFLTHIRPADPRNREAARRPANASAL